MSKPINSNKPHDETFIPVSQEKRLGGRRDREFQITAVALLIISLFLVAIGITLMGVGHMPSVLTSGMAGFFCYFAGAHLVFIGLGVLVSAAIFSVLGICRPHERCASEMALLPHHPGQDPCPLITLI